MRRSILVSTAIVLAAGLCGPLSAQSNQTPETAVGQLVLGMFQSVYEADDVKRGEVTLLNPGREWLTVDGAENLVSSLRLTLENGERVAPKNTERFGAAKTKSIGPAGFIGFTFDATVLFPQLRTPGKYSLQIEHGRMKSRAVAFEVLPDYSPQNDYHLDLDFPEGKVSIDLFEKSAPVAVHNVVNLARTRFFDGASIPRIQKGVALAIVGPASSAHRIVPFENTPSQLLAGTVVLEPRTEKGQRVNYPSLFILLAPQPTWKGKYTVVGQVTKGLELITKLGATETSGPRARPPFRPIQPLSLERASIHTADSTQPRN